MKLPLDTPDWVESILEGCENEIENQMKKAKSADEAMKAVGAFGFWSKLKAEIELEHDNQVRMRKERDLKLHDRTQN